MFIGHIAVSFAAKRAAPRVSISVLIGAALLLDFLWPMFLLAGVEHVEIAPGNTTVTPLAFVHYPISHSLIAAIAWALVAAGAFWILTRYRTGATVVGLAVLSHWFLDAVVHRPDLPLYPGSTIFAGLGLWNSVPGTVIVEGGIFVAGVWLYVTGTRGRDRIGTIALWAFITFVTLLYVGNLVGPAPPSERAVAMAGLAGLLFPVWAGWLDRHRA
jgi:membrane-bound metal-dependent hydrolase YbcI (DUF457 family)